MEFLNHKQRKCHSIRLLVLLKLWKEEKTIIYFLRVIAWKTLRKKSRKQQLSLGFAIFLCLTQIVPTGRLFFLFLRRWQINNEKNARTNKKILDIFVWPTASEFTKMLATCVSNRLDCRWFTFMKVAELTWKVVKGHWDVDLLMLFTIIVFPRFLETKKLLSFSYFSVALTIQQHQLVSWNYFIFIKERSLKAFLFLVLGRRITKTFFSVIYQHCTEMSLNGTRLARKVNGKTDKLRFILSINETDKHYDWMGNRSY